MKQVINTKAAPAAIGPYSQAIYYNQRETVSVTIPVRDRNLLQELVRKFGWACVL